jgi:alkylhydroperoxidase family enzyme
VGDDPRLTPLPAAAWDDTVRDALRPLLRPERADPRDAGNVLATLVRHPGLAQGYLELNAHLLVHSTLSPRVREVALLRAVQARGSEYLWDHHVPIAQRAGLTTADIDELRHGRAVDEVDALTVRVADELEELNTVSDATWSALQAHFDERQILDLIFTIGCYQLLAVAVNVLGIQPEGR